MPRYTMSAAGRAATFTLQRNADLARVAALAIRSPGVLWPWPHRISWQEAEEAAKNARATWMRRHKGQPCPWSV